MEEWTEIRERVLDKIIPEKDEKRRINNFIRELTSKLEAHLSSFEVSVEVHGSVRRGTWLSGKRDIDLFLVLGKEYHKDDINRILSKVKEFLGGDYIEVYAEHPYLRKKIEGFDVEFVPCFKIKRGEELISSTDRTPLHTDFLLNKLDEGEKTEVRLLKQFMRGIGVYGAEIKVKGFSGYLCELLIVEYGSLLKTLQAASDWQEGLIIQFTSEIDQQKLRKIFQDPLIIIDPVDWGRNVSSALSRRNFWIFVAGARSFLDKPSQIFFFKELDGQQGEKIKKKLDERETDLIFIVVKGNGKIVPDILWGQLHKSQDAISRFLYEKGFEVLRFDSWSDEKSLHILIFELGSKAISPVIKHQGPPVRMREYSERFLNIHMESKKTISGPNIEGNRWYVLTRREYNHVLRILNDALILGKEDIGISKEIAENIKESGEILLNSDIEKYFSPDFLSFLSGFLKGRPEWLE
jgi:tRNA nucleotidyltransferase (CCA-adding enzyme)